MQKSNLKVAKGFGHAVQWMNRKTDAILLVQLGDSCLIKLQGNRFWWQSSSGSILGGHSRQIIHNRATMIWSLASRLPKKPWRQQLSQRSEFTVNIVSKNFLLLLKSVYDPSSLPTKWSQNQIRSKSVKNSALVIKPWNMKLNPRFIYISFWS